MDYSNCSNDFKEYSLSESWGQSVVDKVMKTGLTSRESIEAVHVVIAHFKDTVPELGHLFDNAHRSVDKLYEPEINILGRDLMNLCKAIESIKSNCDFNGKITDKDNDMMVANLNKLLIELMSCEPNTVTNVLASIEYSYLHTFIYLLEFEETDVSVKCLLKEILKLVCNSDRTAGCILLDSSIPLLLITHLQSMTTEVGGVETSLCATLLAAIFSCDTSLPTEIHNHINKAFIKQLLNCIEDSMSTVDQKTIEHDMFLLLLAYNSHLSDPASSVVIQALADRDYPAVLLEKILYYFNRDVDPLETNASVTSNSILKFLQDLLAQEITANFFYTNDIKVLLDVVLRHVVDKPLGMKERTENLKLMQLILKQPFFEEEEYKASDVWQCFRSILSENEHDRKETDGALVRQMINEHANILVLTNL